MPQELYWLALGIAIGLAIAFVTFWVCGDIRMSLTVTVEDDEKDADA